MKIVALALGVLAVAGTIVIAIAEGSQKQGGSMGAVALLACVVAVVVMILLGVTLGGRTNPHRRPLPVGEETSPAPAEPLSISPSETVVSGGLSETAAPQAAPSARADGSARGSSEANDVPGAVAMDPQPGDIPEVGELQSGTGASDPGAP
jgi:hypothetical protein